MDITKEIIKKTGEMIEKHLNDYKDEIGVAFSDCDEILEIKLRARYSFAKGKFKIQTGINFATGRIKDNSVLYYDPDQAEFDFDLSVNKSDGGEDGGGGEE